MNNLTSFFKINEEQEEKLIEFLTYNSPKVLSRRFLTFVPLINTLINNGVINYLGSNNKKKIIGFGSGPGFMEACLSIICKCSAELYDIKNPTSPALLNLLKKDENLK